MKGGLVLSGTLANTGVVSLESTGGLTSLVIQGQNYDFRTGKLTGPIGAELRGGGTILLSDNAANLIRGASPVSCPNFCVSLGAARLTNFDNVIEGAGTIGSLATRQLLEFYNYGVVNANASTPLRLVADGVNGGTMMASDGGTLIIFGSYDNRGGTLKAVDGGTVMSRSIEDGGHASIVGTSSRIEIDGIYSSEGGSVTLAGGTLKATDGIVINDGTLTGWGALAGGFSAKNTHVLLNDTARTLEAKQGFVQNGGRITFSIEYDVDKGFMNSTVTISDQYFNVWDSTKVVFRFGENANPESFWSQGKFVLDSFVIFESDAAFARRFSAQRITLSDLFLNNDFVIDAQSYSVRNFKFDPDIGVINLEIGNVSAIPEPGVWLQLMAGFLAIGLMVRRGRDVTPSFSPAGIRLWTHNGATAV